MSGVDWLISIVGLVIITFIIDLIGGWYSKIIG